MTRTAFVTPIRLTEEAVPCRLAAITAHGPYTDGRTYYTYAITFPGDRVSWAAHMLVPTESVVDCTQADFARYGHISIARSKDNSGIATLGPVVAEDTSRDTYVRSLRVRYRALEFPGEVHVPRSASRVKWMEEATAVESIEDDPPELPERRVVSFKNAWTFAKGRKYDVEVYSLNMDSTYEGKAKVVQVDYEDVEGAKTQLMKVYLQTQVPDAEGELLLMGELKTDMRSGRFDVVEG